MLCDFSRNFHQQRLGIKVFRKGEKAFVMSAGWCARLQIHGP